MLLFLGIAALCLFLIYFTLTTKKDCQFCKKNIPRSATVCPFCGKQLPVEKAKNYKPIFYAACIASVIMFVMILQDLMLTNQAPAEKPAKTVTKVEEESKPKFNVDWDATSKQTIADLKQSSSLVRDANFVVDDKEKRINMYIVVNAAIKPELTLEIADTAIRRFGCNAQLHGYKVNDGPAKDYYGPLFDEYKIFIGVANNFTVDDDKKWYIAHVITNGMHTKQKPKLQKMYLK